MEGFSDFQARKSQHLDLAMQEANQASGLSGFDQIRLPHQALPEIDLKEVSLTSKLLGKTLKTPFYLSGMTAGSSESPEINENLVAVCAKRGWMFGLGSQRRQLVSDSEDLINECTRVKKVAKGIEILSNIGLSQVINSGTSLISKLLESLESTILVIHTNPLQEAFQPEGTPNFKGGLNAISNLKKSLKIKIVLKETGCGISKKTAKLLDDAGVDAVDVSGLGGTHWGRIEGQRCKDPVSINASKTFSNWGIPTCESIVNCKGFNFETWASGGVRTGLDALKAVYLGGRAVGFARPALMSLLKGGKDGLNDWMKTIEKEFKVGMFCMGKKSVFDVRGESEKN